MSATITAIVFGGCFGLGIFLVAVGFTRKPPAAADSPAKQKLKKFKAKGPKTDLQTQITENVTQIALAAGLAAGGWLLTGWYAAAATGLVAGWAGPRIVQAPVKRRQRTEEIEAYSQWAEQIRDLVGVSGSLFEAVTLSSINARN